LLFASLFELEFSLWARQQPRHSTGLRACLRQ
jgi:hypothetical protein